MTKTAQQVIKAKTNEREALLMIEGRIIGKSMRVRKLRAVKCQAKACEHWVKALSLLLGS